MATILEFPSRQMLGLSFLEDQIRELLAAKGADEELMEFAAVTVKDIYQRYATAENYSFSLELPGDISTASTEQLQRDVQAGIEQVRAENHAIIVRLIAELTLAQVTRFQLQRD